MPTAAPLRVPTNRRSVLPERQTRHSTRPWRCLFQPVLPNAPCTDTAGNKAIVEELRASNLRVLRVARASVGHQHRQLRMREDVAGGTAEDHLAQPALGI